MIPLTTTTKKLHTKQKTEPPFHMEQYKKRRVNTMKKIMTTITIDYDVKQHIEQNRELKSLSDYVNTTYRDEFMILEKEKERVKQLQWDLQLALERVRQLEKEQSQTILSQKAIDWLRTEGLRRSKMADVDLDAIRRFFNTEYHVNLTYKEFKLQLDSLALTK